MTVNKKKTRKKVNLIEEKQKLVEANLRVGSLLPIEELFRKYNTSTAGISVVDIDDLVDEYGENRIDTGNENTIYKQIREAIINPFNIVLIVVALITLFTDIILPVKKDYATFILITSTILISSAISLFQSVKSDSAAKKLRKMITNKLDVYRDEVLQQVEAENILPGDIIKFSSGDMIPADVRFFETKDLFVDQAALTGESNPVEKFTTCKGIEPITEIPNVGFMGTNIVSGSAKAVVLSIGNETYFGNMAKSLSAINEKNSFEKGIDDISSLLIRFILIMLPIILAINLFTGKGTWDSIIFAITIAVGITPEMLPVIMTTTMAAGAIEMSKKKTIVKKMSAIQTFGQMDILCTDKTGTLTEDEIILERYMDVTGREDSRVLRHAFLNSYYQTGLKNLIDIAIINRAEKERMGVLKEKYIREDEIPFDFSRRRMSVVLKDDSGKRQLITKGAVDEMLSICAYIEKDGQVLPMSAEAKAEAYQVYEKYNKEGLRILSVAQKNNVREAGAFNVSDESDMVLLGFIGFLDPPKESAAQAIVALKKHGIDTVVLTGDSEGVALHVCEKVGITVNNYLSGKDVESMKDAELKERILDTHLYAKLSPLQKQRIVRLYQEMGRTVGYMGDGINDSPALKQADVSISVDTAVDIAKETADIILLEKDLNVLEQGVINGRKTFTNVLKYINMATSGNFGNIISVIIASLFLPFLPLKPVHILIQNILNDFAQTGMPFDNVDADFIEKPKSWNTKGIRRFMVIFGLFSTILDICCFFILWNFMGFNTVEKATYFQTGWFAFGIISQTMIIHMIRTNKTPLKDSSPSKQLILSTSLIVLVTILICFTDIATIFDLTRLPLSYLLWILALLVLYATIIQIYKYCYTRKTGSWL
ncbi:MAG: magnesium-translocating P-type ATPase [Erysipelotrichaceae bacterium]|nr:magnesium-translocating P-type ATPase [Erysipelotrichaceae bacterium]